MRKLFKERKLFKGGNYMRKYGIYESKQHALLLFTFELFSKIYSMVSWTAKSASKTIAVINSKLDSL